VIKMSATIQYQLDTRFEERQTKVEPTLQPAPTGVQTEGKEEVLTADLVDRTDLKEYKISGIALDIAITALGRRLAERIVNEMLKSLRKIEISRLMVFTRSLETDPDRLMKLMEAAGERLNYSCHIIWLVNMPHDSLPERYKRVEEELFRLVLHNRDVHVTMLDSGRYPLTASALMDYFGIEDLPAMIIADRLINLEKPDKNNTIVVKAGALDRIARNTDVLKKFISNIPVWARRGTLKKRVKWEAEVKQLLGKLWDEIKSLVTVNIPA
jgi:hypothetical protein